MCELELVLVLVCLAVSAGREASTGVKEKKITSEVGAVVRDTHAHSSNPLTDFPSIKILNL